MRFLIIQEAGRHEANRNFRESLSLQRALIRIGHEAEVWGLGCANHDPEKTPSYAGFKAVEQYAPDVVFLLENYDQTGWVPDLSFFNGPRVYWSIDAHCNLDEHLRHCLRMKATHVLSSSYGYLHALKVPGAKTFWFPNAFDDELVGPRPEVVKEHFLGFCGSYVNRRDWIENLDRAVGIKRDIFIIGEAMVQAINSYKIHFNRNMADDINYRTFETTACGTMLLTNYTPGLERLFDIGREILVYRDPTDLIRILDDLKQHPEKIEAVAAAGYARARMEHSYIERVKSLCHILNYAA